MFILLGIVLFSSSGDGISFPGDGAAGGSEDVAAPPSFPCQVLSWGVHKLISQLNMLLTFIWTSCPCPNLTWSDFENVVGQDVSEELVQEITQHLFFLQAKSSWPKYLVHYTTTTWARAISKRAGEAVNPEHGDLLPSRGQRAPRQLRGSGSGKPRHHHNVDEDKPANWPDVVLCAG